MENAKKNKPSSYGQFVKEARENLENCRGIHHSLKDLLHFYLRKVNSKTQLVWWSQPEIAEMTGMKLRTVQRAVRLAVDLGALKVVYRNKAEAMAAGIKLKGDGKGEVRNLNFIQPMLGWAGFTGEPLPAEVKEQITLYFSRDFRKSCGGNVRADIAATVAGSNARTLPPRWRDQYRHGGGTNTATVAAELQGTGTTALQGEKDEPSRGLRPRTDESSLRSFKGEGTEPSTETQASEDTLDFDPGSCPWFLEGPAKPRARRAASLASGRVAAPADALEQVPLEEAREEVPKALAAPAVAGLVPPAPRGDKEYDLFVENYNYIVGVVRAAAIRLGPGSNDDEWMRPITPRNEPKVWALWREDKYANFWRPLLERVCRSEYLLGMRCALIQGDNKFFVLSPISLFSLWRDIEKGKYDDSKIYKDLWTRMQASHGILQHCLSRGIRDADEAVRAMRRFPSQFSLSDRELMLAEFHLRDYLG